MQIKDLKYRTLWKYMAVVLISVGMAVALLGCALIEGTQLPQQAVQEQQPTYEPAQENEEAALGGPDDDFDYASQAEEMARLDEWFESIVPLGNLLGSDDHLERKIAATTMPYIMIVSSPYPEIRINREVTFFTYVLYQILFGADDSLFEVEIRSSGAWQGAPYIPEFWSENVAEYRAPLQAQDTVAQVFPRAIWDEVMARHFYNLQFDDEQLLEQGALSYDRTSYIIYLPELGMAVMPVVEKVELLSDDTIAVRIGVHPLYNLNTEPSTVYYFSLNKTEYSFLQISEVHIRRGPV